MESAISARKMFTSWPTSSCCFVNSSIQNKRVVCVFLPVHLSLSNSIPFSIPTNNKISSQHQLLLSLYGNVADKFSGAVDLGGKNQALKSGVCQSTVWGRAAAATRRARATAFTPKPHTRQVSCSAWCASSGCARSSARRAAPSAPSASCSLPRQTPPRAAHSRCALRALCRWSASSSAPSSAPFAARATFGCGSRATPSPRTRCGLAGAGSRRTTSRNSGCRRV